MIASLLARYAGRGEREVDRYAAWLAALRRLRADWAEGERPTAGGLSDYLRFVPEEQRGEAMQDLLAEHLFLTWQAGEELLLEYYVTELGGKFPELASLSVLPVELVEDEFLARYQLPHGDKPGVEEYERRFAARPDLLVRLRSRLLDDGRFVKLNLRGLGAMGAVWETHDRQRNDRVALKEPRADLLDPAAVLHRFSIEAQVTSALDHPGIVTMREVRPANGGSPFYLMRLVEGAMLSEYIRDVQVPPPGQSDRAQRACEREILQRFVRLCEAVAHAHSRGILHRDLTPANVVVDEAGGVALLDWDLAQSLTAGSTPSGVVVGTPDYMPPEQANGHSDVRSDVFGLGAILYEILTGRSPQGWVDGARPANWLELVRRADFPAPWNSEARIPRAIAAVCLKALSREPERRYPSAAAVGAEVQQYLAGEPVVAWREPAYLRAWRWLRTLV